MCVCVFSNKPVMHLCPPPAAPQVMSSQPQGGRVRRRPFGHFLQHHGGLGHALLLAAQRGAVLVRAVSPEGHVKSMGNGWKIMGISPGYHRNMGKSWETNGDYLVFSSRNQAYSWVEGTFLWLIPRSLLTVGSASKTGWFKQFSRNQMVSPCFTHKNGGFNLTKKTTTSLRRLGGVWPQLKSCSHFTSQGRPRSIPASHHPNIYWHLFNSCIIIVNYWNVHIYIYTYVCNV